jgi:hypothetical protein
MPRFVQRLAALVLSASPILGFAKEPVTEPVVMSAGPFGVRRSVAYVVVDSAPRAVGAPVSYPYGWFGAAPHATERWTHTGYYYSYKDLRILRGR